ncbi:MAG: NAD(P)/FAD-dependent oxidoreductase [Pyrinomonadaceae bacterium]
MSKLGESANEYDVIIGGGGPAGSSAAIRLGATGARVLLVEQKKFPRAKLCGEFISPECAAHFTALGVLAEMTAAGATRVVATDFYTRGGHKVSVPSAWFGADGGGYAHNSCALGLSRAEMDHRLLMRARAVGVEVLEETTASGLVREDGRVCGVELQHDGAQRVARAPVTIDATGRARVLVRRVARARADDEHSNDHGQPHQTRARLVAFKAHLDNVKLADGACEIYFYRGGYGGLSRVEGGLSNLCFIVAARDVRARGSDADRVMREVLMTNQRAAETLRGARVRSEWLAVALESFGRAKLVPAAGLLTVGDAAAFIDPFTGSGMLMALESGALAADVIAHALPALRAGHDFAALADDYRAHYRARFNARLRVCSVLRRAAFAPSIITATAALALNTSASLRRVLARATRQSA